MAVLTVFVTLFLWVFVPETLADPKPWGGWGVLATDVLPCGGDQQAPARELTVGMRVCAVADDEDVGTITEIQASHGGGDGGHIKCKVRLDVGRVRTFLGADVRILDPASGGEQTNSSGGFMYIVTLWCRPHGEGPAARTRQRILILAFTTQLIAAFLSMGTGQLSNAFQLGPLHMQQQDLVVVQATGKVATILATPATMLLLPVVRHLCHPAASIQLDQICIPNTADSY